MNEIRRENETTDESARREASTEKGLLCSGLFSCEILYRIPAQSAFQYVQVSLTKMYHVFDKGKLLGLIFVEENNISLERSTKIIG